MALRQMLNEPASSIGLPVTWYCHRRLLVVVFTPLRISSEPASAVSGVLPTL